MHHSETTVAENLLGRLGCPFGCGHPGEPRLIFGHDRDVSLQLL